MLKTERCTILFLKPEIRINWQEHKMFTVFSYAKMCVSVWEKSWKLNKMLTPVMLHLTRVSDYWFFKMYQSLQALQFFDLFQQSIMSVAFNCIAS